MSHSPNLADSNRSSLEVHKSNSPSAHQRVPTRVDTSKQASRQATSTILDSTRLDSTHQHFFDGFSLSDLTGEGQPHLGIASTRQLQLSFHLPAIMSVCVRERERRDEHREKLYTTVTATVPRENSQLITAYDTPCTSESYTVGREGNDRHLK